MRAAVCESAALALLLGLAVCADGITALPGGWWLLYGGLALAWLLGKLAHWEIPNHARKGKRKPPRCCNTRAADKKPTC